jgi:hypothetical protein
MSKLISGIATVIFFIVLGGMVVFSGVVLVAGALVNSGVTTVREGIVEVLAIAGGLIVFILVCNFIDKVSSQK